MRLVLNSIALILISSCAFAEAPPKTYVDKGACPFECCTYREWTVTKDTDLYESIHGKKIIGKAKKGQTVQGLTGEVHTHPLKVKIKMREGSEAMPSEVKDKDVVYLLTYQGEGFWKVWKNGKVIEGVSENWDEKKRPDSTWWVQIKLKDGKTGWTKHNENFANIDACG